MSDNKPKSKLSKSSLFMMSATSGMIATSIVQPIDLIKIRMQLSGVNGGVKEHKTFLHAFYNVTKTEGLFGLYNGLSAGLFRQVTYTGTRLGIYSILEDSLSREYNGPLPTSVKLLSACVAGGIGALVGTPSEVALIRMTADGRLSPAERRGYKNVFHALYCVVKTEGVLSLWTGVSPTVVRAVVLNAAQLTSYSEAKEKLIKSGFFSDNIACHFTASMISGLLATTFSTPIDTIKTRLQNNRGEFSGVFDVIKKTVKNEGPFGLMKGFTPFYLRLGPHTVLTFLAYEQLKSLFS